MLTNHDRSPRVSPLLEAVGALETDERLDPLARGLTPLARPLGRGAARSVLGGRWLGHALHPLLTDFPLGCWIGSGLLDLAGGPASRRAAQRLVGLGLLFTVPTAAAGLSDWTSTDDPKARRVGAVHAALNATMAVTYWRSWSLRRRGRHGAGVAVALLGGTLGWVSGYLGGHLSLRRFIGTGEPSSGVTTNEVTRADAR